METNTTPTDAERMQTVLDEIPITSYRLTQELEMSSGAVYHVLSGKNKLSKNLIDKICNLYPEVNKKYLLKGIGDPLIDNKVSGDSEYILVKKQDFDQVQQDIKTIYEMLKKIQEK
jgi:ClpP class serine protease